MCPATERMTQESKMAANPWTEFQCELVCRAHYTLTHKHIHKNTAATAAAAAPVLTAQQNRLLFVFYLCRHCSMLVPYKTEARVTTYAEIIMKKKKYEQIERKSEWNFNLLQLQKQSKYKFILHSFFNCLHDDDNDDDQKPTCNYIFFVLHRNFRK